VFALKVKFVAVAANQFEEQVIVLAPKVHVLTVVPDNQNVEQVTAKPLVFKVPDVKVTVPAVAVKVSERRYELPTPFTVKLPSTFVPVVIVCCVAEVDFKLIAEVVVLPFV
jgi:hypothetical protein